MTAEEIVRALAAADPVVVSALNSGWEYAGTCYGPDYACGVCRTEASLAPETHKPDCPWRLAVEWVEANTA